MNISEILELNERAKEDGRNFPRARQFFQSNPIGTGKTLHRHSRTTGRGENCIAQAIGSVRA